MPDSVVDPWHPKISEHCAVTAGTLRHVDAVRDALADALEYRGRLPSDVLEIEGMSGKKYRFFINNLIARLGQGERASYLDVGSWKGSTFCSAICGNNAKALDSQSPAR